MDDYLDRQLTLSEQFIAEYGCGKISLNTFVQRIEGVALAAGSDFWTNIISPLIGPMEEVNALALDERRGLDDEDKKIIEDSLSKLKIAICKVRSMGSI